MSANAKGALLALLAFGIFATHDVFVKTLGAIYSPIQIVFFSVLFSFPLATVMLMRDAKPGTLLPRHPWWMALRTIASVATAVSAFYAFTVLPLAQTYAILFASPLLITILAIPVLGETVRLRRWLAVIVGLTGVMVVLQPGATELTLGHAAALTAAVGGSIASIIVRRIGADERPVVMLLYPMVANFVVMGAALAFVYIPMPIEHLGLVALVAAFAWTAGRCIIVAYQSGEAAIIAPMQYSQIIWATLYGALFFDETIGRPTLIGAGIIIASGLYIVLRESRTDVSSTTPVLRTRSRHETGTYMRAGPLLRLLGRHPDS
ncbi:MAG: DMT family transporter [Octadecabacter sp.]|jgi:drug/metabolite transporter (DMT)-like permease|nr:DMT family transporter [Octadecabacter sp.]MDC1398109.1 DMT family transporter [Octadecabacter sp.]MDC1501285.1 DMT family transporter [Octadecabacter sp.]|tara:strand:- start:6388 stop:7347 length:960 start_codon:yes stop_codon:yes gene_type:complete